MTRKFGFLFFVLAVGLAMICTPILAHHGTAA